MNSNDELLAVLREVAAVFGRLNIPYAVGGSIASSILGRPRLTLDADITADPFSILQADFVSAFGADYYLSEEAVSEALQKRSSFNIIHLPTGFKVDVFIRKDRPYEQTLMQRKMARLLPDSPEQPLYFVSAEDIVLLKLEWYRLGGESSDRQWGDILGVLKAQSGELDEVYLNHWAKELNVSDLLARARQES